MPPRPKNQTQPKRRDPRGRHIDGATPWNKLQNRDPRFHYVYAYELDSSCGVPYYESLGYKPVIYEQDGVRPLAGVTCKPGEPIRFRDNVLMCIPIADRERIEQEGPDGNSGQRLTEELENVILDKNGTDLLRGMRGNPAKYFSVVNETMDEGAFAQ